MNYVLDRLKAGFPWVVSLTPIAALSTVDWYSYSLKAFAFVASLATALSAATAIAFFLRRRGKGLAETWKHISSLGSTNATILEIAAVVVPKGLPDLGQQLANVRRDMRVHDHKLKAFQDAGTVMTFESSAAGRWTWVSDSLEVFIGAKSEDLLGLGWLTYVDDNERTSVSREWAQAILERRQFDLNVLFRRTPTLPKDEIEPEKWVRIVASPVHEGEEPACYTGHGRTIKDHPQLNLAESPAHVQ